MGLHIKSSCRPRAATDSEVKSALKVPVKFLNKLSKLGFSENSINYIQALLGSDSFYQTMQESLSLLEDLILFIYNAGVQDRFKKLLNAFVFASKFFKVLFSVVNLRSHIESKSPTAESIVCSEWLGVDGADPQEHDDINYYTLRGSDIISGPFFRSSLNIFAKIHAIKNITIVSKIEAVSFEGYITSGEFLIFAVYLEFEGTPVLLLDKGKQFEIYINRKRPNAISDFYDTFVLKANSAILNSLKSHFLVISGSSRYMDEVKFTLENLQKPKFYDLELYNFLFPIIKKSLDSSIKTGILIYGRPGVSKTSTVLKILNELDLIKLRLPNSGYALAKSLLAGTNAKKAVLIDDMDVGENAEKTGEVSNLLDFLDSNCYDVVIMVVNKLEVDPTIIRPGRVDIRRFCKEPDYKHRIQIIKNILQDMKELSDFGIGGSFVGESERVDELAELFEGLTHAEIHTIFKNSVRNGNTLEDSFALYKQMALESENYKQEISEI